MHFQAKNTLKSNCYRNVKHYIRDYLALQSLLFFAQSHRKNNLVSQITFVFSNVPSTYVIVFQILAL